jgi:hypothetical protein
MRPGRTAKRQRRERALDRLLEWRRKLATIGHVSERMEEEIETLLRRIK